jgi:site-specific DNA recombinase
MTQIAIYARFSCDKQSETSLEDQTRRCLELAARHGLPTDKPRVYSDAAVSGTDKGDLHRESYRQLSQDWESGKFQVLLVDEFSRLTRDPVEQARLLKRLENNRRVRLITADGIDTQAADWQLTLGLQGLLAQHESRKLRHRVDRGMLGQLERGYMIATAPYGYDIDRELDSRQEHIGTHWRVNPLEAAIVKEVFARREAGDSMHQIAAWLNSEGVLCSRAARTADGGHWRPARVKNMLSNSIYRGVFVWHGSTNYAAKMKAQGLPVETREFARPHLRLVSDETWKRCNTRSVSRSGYGGGAHALGGLFTCSLCGSILAITALRRCRSLYCPNCTEMKRTKDDPTRLTATIAASGVETLLVHALSYFVTEPFLQAFRQSLRLRLTGDRQVEVKACEDRLERHLAAQKRLSHMLVAVTEDDEVLRQRYEEAREKVKQAREQLAGLMQGLERVNTQAVEAQLSADPVALLGGLFQAGLEPQRLRAVLHRLFPALVFEGKSGRYQSHFTVRFAPGIALAMASGTEVVSEEELEAKFLLRYWPSNQRHIPPGWTVDVLGGAQPVAPADPVS